MSGSTLLSLRRRIAFTLLAVAGAWLCAESVIILFRFFNPPTVGNDFPFMYQAHPYRAYCLVPGVTDRLGQSSHNSLGLRGPEVSVDKPEGTIRIICIGGSTTMSISATTDTHTYPARMEAILRTHYRDAPFEVEVLNAGVGASTSMESLVYFQTRLLDFSPDVAVFHHGMNDTYIMTVLPDFAADYSHARRPFFIEPPRWWEISPFLSYWFARGSIHNRFFPCRDPNLNELIVKIPRAARHFDTRALTQLTPEMVAAFERNIRSFVMLARRNGVIPVLSTQVHQAQIVPGNVWFMVMKQVTTVVREVAARESVDLIDFAKAMSWSADHFIDAVHLKDNESGLGAKARFFADSLIAMRVIDRAYERRTTGGASP